MSKRALVVGVLFLAACQGQVASTVKKAGAASPSVRATASSPGAAVALRKPADGGVALTGTVRADAGYLVQHGLGSLNGDAVVANNGGGIISDNGGGVIANNGSGLIANNGGNVIASLAGGEARSTDRGALLAAGNGVLSNNGAGRRVLAAGPKPGTVLPAAGMLVSAISLRTRQYLPVGVDDAGRPAYAVYSNAQGGYTLYLPKAEAGNVVVVANVPGSADERVVYGDLRPLAGGTAARPLDPDTAAAVQTVRKIAAALVAEMVTTPDIQDVVTTLSQENKGLPPFVLQLYTDLVTALSHTARELDVPTGSEALDIPEVRALAQAVADAALGYLDYDALQTSNVPDAAYLGEHGQAYELTGKVFADLRARTAAYLDAKLAAGATLPLDVPVAAWHAINVRGDNCTRNAIVKVSDPGDLGTYLIEDVLARYSLDTFVDTDMAFRATALVPFKAFKGAPDPNDPAYLTNPATGQLYSQGSRLGASAQALLLAIATTMLPLDRQPGDPPSAPMAAVMAVAHAWMQAHPGFGQPRPQPWLGGVPCYPPGPLSKDVPPGPAPEGATGDPAATP